MILGIIQAAIQLEKFWLHFILLLVMGRTPFYRTSIELEHHFSNIERTRTCSFFDDQTRTPYFWLRMIERSNIKPTFTKLLIKLT